MNSPELTKVREAPVDKSLHAVVKGEIFRQLRKLFSDFTAQGLQYSLDGVRVLEAGDKFLPGKICAGFAHVLVEADAAEREKLVPEFRAMVDLTCGMRNDTWGIYYACAGLYALKKAGLLEAAVSPSALATMRQSADWRHFVRTGDYSLIDLPTNYYGVAFSIARLRMLLGWEDASASDALLEKTLEHYDAHSGEYGFCDDTDGEGRFDRYSILLVAEICERFIETGLEVTPKLRALLRNSANVTLKLASAQGDGFCFGRSLGPYGDTAVLQILSVSAYLNVLSAEEKPYAYSLCAAVVRRYIDFWFNPDIGSVDMWGQGRRVDTYRGKSRIFGENLSLIHQLIGAEHLWKAAGYVATNPCSPFALQNWLIATQAPLQLVPFADAEHHRALAIYRDRQHVFSLLMVNGGSTQHMNSPYYPLPFARGIIEGIADSGLEHPQLMPKITLDDGTELMGTAYFKQIECDTSGGVQRVRYRLDSLCRLGGSAPVEDSRLGAEVEYLFEPGRITRTERFVPHQSIQVRALSLDFLSFSFNALQAGGGVMFHKGGVKSFQATGVDHCQLTALDGHTSLRSPNGAMRSLIKYRRDSFSASAPFTVQWTLTYQ